MCEWKETELQEIAVINPTERLAKGTEAKKIAMELLQPFTKKISTYTREKYKGGVKFRNGDTLVARITPSLENGKTSFVDLLEDDEVGFGSTEFIVLRKIEDISDKNYLFYLACSPEFRDVAIASMTGTSGRQRVQTDVVKQHEFIFPPLSEQRAIASVLSSLDDKIDLLHRQNKTLEAMAETLFRQWFVEDTNNKLKIDKLGSYVSVIDNRGKTPPHKNIKTDYPIIEVNALTGEDRLVDYTVIRKYVDKDTYINWFRGHPKKYDSLISTVGSIGEISMFLVENGTIAQNVIALTPKIISPFYLYQFLKYLRPEIKELDIGSVQPSIKVPHLLSMDFVLPKKEKMNKFDEQVIGYLSKMEVNHNQIRTLEKLRDTLLPKLMSGEVRVNLEQQEAVV